MANTVASRLKSARERANLTQKQVADAVGVTKATVDHWEHDMGGPRVEHAQALCKVLDITTNWLVLGKERAQ